MQGPIGCSGVQPLPKERAIARFFKAGKDGAAETTGGLPGIADIHREPAGGVMGGELPADSQTAARDDAQPPPFGVTGLKTRSIIAIAVGLPSGRTPRLYCNSTSERPAAIWSTSIVSDCRISAGSKPAITQGMPKSSTTGL